MKRIAHILASVFAACALLACGGTDAAAPAPTPSPTPAPTPAPTPSVAAPVITTPPQGITVTTGDAVTFKVTATGADLQYQWLRNGNPVAGATQASYTLPATPVSETETQWSVSVRNSGGTVTSSVANLRVWNTPGVRTLAGGGASVLSESRNRVDGPADVAEFRGINGMAIGKDGTVYVSDPGSIRKISLSGNVTTLAGGAVPGFADGVGSEAGFGNANSVGPTRSCSFTSDHCMDLAVDIDGNVFVADTLVGALRKVSPQGVVTTLMGGPSKLQRDGVLAEAGFGPYVYGVAVMPDGTLRVVDPESTDSLCCVVRKIDKLQASSVGTALYPSSYNISEARLQIDPLGFVLATSYRSVIHRVSETGELRLVAGALLGGSLGFFQYPSDSDPALGYLDGPGDQARFSGFVARTTDSLGNIYVGDVNHSRGVFGNINIGGNFALRKITPDGMVTTLAGEKAPVNKVVTTKERALFGTPLIPRGMLVFDAARGRLIFPELSFDRSIWLVREVQLPAP